MGTESDDIGADGSVTSKIKAEAENLQEHAATLGKAIDETTERLSSRELPLTHFASELSSHLSNLSDLVENSSLDSIAARARNAAKDNPTLFVLGGIAAGFAVSRFLRAGVTEGEAGKEPDERGSPDEQSPEPAARAIRSNVSDGDA